MIDDSYRRVIDHYGAAHQKRKAAEELTELAAELLKDLDGHGNPAHVIEELADVENVCAELRIIYDPGNLVDHWREVKMHRAVRRIEANGAP